MYSSMLAAGGFNEHKMSWRFKLGAVASSDDFSSVRAERRNVSVPNCRKAFRNSNLLAQAAETAETHYLHLI